MKKMICLLLVLACLCGTMLTAHAEKGFELLYGLFSSEEVFGEPGMVREGDTEPVCFAIFLFDPEYDITNVLLLGANEEGEGKYIQWQTDYEPGATIMTFLVTKFAALKAACEEGVDFCIAFSFDEGETMTEIDTIEAARDLMTVLQIEAENQDDAESVATLQELLESMK